MSKTMLKLEDVSLSFGGIKAVANVDMDISEGEIIGLIGPNGAGKTTIFNIITGVYQADSGSITFYGESISHLTPQQIVGKGIARTFQNIRLFKNMKVIENVLVGTHLKTSYTLMERIFQLSRYQKQESEKVALALHILKTLGLLEKKDEYAGNLPYGDQRKVEIARAIATGAQLILLDEPAAGMNHTESLELLDFIKHLKELGFTILLIEHDMSVVMNISDRVYVLDNGKRIAEGIPREVANNEKVIQAYLGGAVC